MDADIRHDARQRRFVVTLDGQESRLSYEPLESGAVDYCSTYVPPPLRGRGVAARLVRHALDHARTAGWRVVPSCSYVALFLERHPEYRDLAR